MPFRSDHSYVDDNDYTTTVASSRHGDSDEETDEYDEPVDVQISRTLHADDPDYSNTHNSDHSDVDGNDKDPDYTTTIATPNEWKTDEETDDTDGTYDSDDSDDTDMDYRYSDDTDFSDISESPDNSDVEDSDDCDTTPSPPKLNTHPMEVLATSSMNNTPMASPTTGNQDLRHRIVQR